MTSNHEVECSTSAIENIDILNKVGKRKTRTKTRRRRRTRMFIAKVHHELENSQKIVAFYRISFQSIE